MSAPILMSGFPEFRAYLDRLAESPLTMSYRYPLANYLPFLAARHKQHFDGAQDAGGTPWKPLAPSTVAKKGHSTILVETGKLKASLSAVGGPSNIAEAQDNYLVFGTSDEKARFHQSGTSRMPARPPVGMSDEDLEKLSNDLADHVVKQLLEIR